MLKLAILILAFAYATYYADTVSTSLNHSASIIAGVHK